MVMPFICISSKCWTKNKNGDGRLFKWLWTWHICWCQTGLNWSDNFRNCWCARISTQPTPQLTENALKEEYPVCASSGWGWLATLDSIHQKKKKLLLGQMERCQDRIDRQSQFDWCQFQFSASTLGWWKLKKKKKKLAQQYQPGIVFWTGLNQCTNIAKKNRAI